MLRHGRNDSLTHHNNNSFCKRGTNVSHDNTILNINPLNELIGESQTFLKRVTDTSNEEQVSVMTKWFTDSDTDSLKHKFSLTRKAYKRTLFNLVRINYRFRWIIKRSLNHHWSGVKKKKHGSVRKPQKGVSSPTHLIRNFSGQKIRETNEI